MGIRDQQPDQSKTQVSIGSNQYDASLKVNKADRTVFISGFLNRQADLTDKVGGERILVNLPGVLVNPGSSKPIDAGMDIIFTDSN
jgi:hypothetical protein